VRVVNANEVIALFFPRRLGRVSFFVRSCATSLLVWGFIGASLSKADADVTTTIVVLLATIYSTFWVVLPRMRDLAMRPFWLIILVVPVIDVGFGLVLLFRPSAIALPRSIARPESQGTAQIVNDAELEGKDKIGKSHGPRVYMTPTLIILNVIIFGLMVVRSDPVLKATSSSLVQWGANYGPLTLGGQWWRLVASCFLHLGIVHLVSNMVALAIIGPFMEKLLGNVAYLTLYLMAGIAGSAASLALYPFVISAGASANIMGLYGALVAVFIRCREAVPGEKWARQSKVMAAFIGFCLLYGLFSPEVDVDIAGHFGGLLSGFVLGLCLAQRVPQKAVGHRWRNTMAGISGVTLVVATVLILAKQHDQANKGNLDGAIADYDRAIAFAPKVSGVYGLRGAAKVAKGDLDGAIADYDQAIQLNPEFAEAYSLRGAAKVAKGDLDGAIADYGRGIQLDPTLAETYYSRGSARLTKGDLDGALVDGNRAIELNPKLAVAYGLRGSAKLPKGNLDGAIADFDQAIELNPQDADAYSNRGLTRARKRDYQGAKADYERAKELKP
jgi:membrane associated rhomboid family serine protease/Flp pilus assembly protein TadD